MKTEANVWFITGAMRGFGVRIACAALDAGHRVVATGRDWRTTEEALGVHSEFLVLPLDVTSEAPGPGGGRCCAETFRPHRRAGQ